MALNFKSVLITLCLFFSSSQVLASISAEIYEEYADQVVLVGVKDGSGTGFFISKDLILTNKHVLEEKRTGKYNLNKLKIMNIKGEEIPGLSGVACSTRADICMIILEGANLKDLNNFYKRIYETPDLKVGEKVYAIGHPSGNLWTISEGIIGSKERPIDNAFYSQLSMPISQGNSGGPLFNSNKDIVGIVTFVHLEAANVAFALSKKEIYAFAHQIFRGNLEREIFYVGLEDEKYEEEVVIEDSNEDAEVIEEEKPIKAQPIVPNNRYRDLSIFTGSFLNPRSKYQFQNNAGEQELFDISGAKAGLNLGARLNLRETTSRTYNFIEGEYRYLDLGDYLGTGSPTTLNNQKLLLSIGVGRYLSSSVRLSVVGALGLGYSEISEDLSELKDSRGYYGFQAKAGFNYEFKISDRLYHIELLYNGAYFDNEYKDRIVEHGLALSFGTTFSL